MTSSGGMFPRLTFGPKCFTNHAWLDFVGASKMRSEIEISCAISSIRPVRMSPSLRKIPAVPPSRASVITFHAPALFSSLIHSTHWYGA
jgi:hypothetical protein